MWEIACSVPLARVGEEAVISGRVLVGAKSQRFCWLALARKELEGRRVGRWGLNRCAVVVRYGKNGAFGRRVCWWQLRRCIVVVRCGKNGAFGRDKVSRGLVAQVGEIAAFVSREMRSSGSALCRYLELFSGESYITAF